MYITTRQNSIHSYSGTFIDTWYVYIIGPECIKYEEQENTSRNIRQRVKDKPVGPSVCDTMYTSDQPTTNQPTDRPTDRPTDKQTGNVAGSLAFACKVRARSGNACILHPSQPRRVVPTPRPPPPSMTETERDGRACFIIVASHPKSGAAARKGVANRGAPCDRPACYRKHSGLGSCATTSRGALT